MHRDHPVAAAAPQRFGISGAQLARGRRRGGDIFGGVVDGEFVDTLPDLGIPHQHVQGNHLDTQLADQFRGQAGGRIGDDHDRHVSPHLLQRFHHRLGDLGMPVPAPVDPVGVGVAGVDVVVDRRLQIHQRHAAPVRPGL